MLGLFVFLASSTAATTARSVEGPQVVDEDCDWMEDWKKDRPFWPDIHVHFGTAGGGGLMELEEEYGEGTWVSERMFAAWNYHAWMEQSHMGSEHPACQ